MHRANWNKELLFFFPRRIKWVFALQLKAVPQLVLYNEYTIITGAVRLFFCCFIFYSFWVKVMRKEVIWRRSIWKCNWPLVRFCWNGIRYCSENTAFPLKFLMSRLWSSCLVSGPDRSSPQSTSAPCLGTWKPAQHSKQVIHSCFGNKSTESRLTVFNVRRLLPSFYVLVWCSVWHETFLFQWQKSIAAPLNSARVSFIATVFDWKWKKQRKTMFVTAKGQNGPA